MAIVVSLMPGTMLRAQLERRRLEVARDADRAPGEAPVLQPASGRVRLFFVRPSRSPVPELGVELRFNDGFAGFVGPGTFTFNDVEPGTHPILARTLWGYVQAITFTKDHGTLRPVEWVDPGVPGPCCPKALLRELSRTHQRLSVLNWEVHRLLWELPEHLAKDPRTEVLIAGYQKRGVPSRVMEMEIGAEAGETLFFRIRLARDGEISVRPLGRREGARLVRRTPMSAVRLRVTDANAYEASAGYPVGAAPETSQGIMSNGLLEPLGERVPGLAAPRESSEAGGAGEPLPQR